MKQKIIFAMLAFVLSVFLTSLCFSAPGSVKNVGNIGGTSSNFDPHAAALADGDFVISATVWEDSFGTGDFTNLTANGDFDTLITIFNYDLDADTYAPGYMYNFGGDGYDWANNIIARSGGGFAYVGYSDLFGTYDWTGISGFGASDATLITSTGDLTTDPVGKNMGTPLDDQYYDLVELSDGSIVAVGYAGGNYGPGVSVITMFPKTGNPASATISSALTSEFRGVTVGSDGFPVAVGSVNIGSSSWIGLTGNGEDDATIVKYNLAGARLWPHNFGGESSDFFYDVVTVADGGYVAVGKSAEASFNTGDWTGIAGKGQFDAIIVKYASDGTLVWKHTFGGAGDDEFVSAAATKDGGIVAVGSSYEESFGTYDWTGFTGKGLQDAVIVKYNADGSIAWRYNFGGDDADSFTGVTVKKNGNIVAVGNSYPTSFGTDDLSNLTAKGPDGDIVYAVFEDVNYVTAKFLTYGNNKDIIFNEQEVVAGNTVSAPPTNPTRLGFAFNGWYANEALTTPFNFSNPINADTYVYPKWAASGSDVTITYDNDGSGNSTDRIVSFSSRVTLNAMSSNLDGNFLYWEDGNGYIRSYNFVYTFVATEDITLNAIYALGPIVSNEPIVNIDTTNMASAPVGGRVNISFFGDVFPNNFTVIEKGIIGSYYRETGDYNRTTDNFDLNSAKIVKVPIPGSATKIQATFKNAVATEDYCARTYLIYELDGEPITIYSPAISIYRHTP